MTHELKVYTTLIEGHSVLNYVYWCSPDMGFKFHLLAEVGQPWFAEARDKADALAKKRGCVIRRVGLNSDPWYVEALIKEKEVANC